jgi:hypothetical protein
MRNLKAVEVIKERTKGTAWTDKATGNWRKLSNEVF